MQNGKGKILGKKGTETKGKGKKAKENNYIFHKKDKFKMTKAKYL